MNNALGLYIRQVREPVCSLRAFAAKIGKSPSWLSKVERGEEIPGAPTLALIADLLEIPRPKLFAMAGVIEPDLEAAIIADYERLEPMIRALLDQQKPQAGVSRAWVRFREG